MTLSSSVGRLGVDRTHRPRLLFVKGSEGETAAIFPSESGTMFEQLVIDEDVSPIFHLSRSV